jgi:hypothetical protein
MNGKVTIKDVYDKLGNIQNDVGEIKGKAEATAEDVKAMKKTLESHTEKIGFLRGQATMWGFVGGGIATIVGGVMLYFLTHK